MEGFIFDVAKVEAYIVENPNCTVEDIYLNLGLEALKVILGSPTLMKRLKTNKSYILDLVKIEEYIVENPNCTVEDIYFNLGSEALSVILGSATLMKRLKTNKSYILAFVEKLNRKYFCQLY